MVGFTFSYTREINSISAINCSGSKFKLRNIDLPVDSKRDSVDLSSLDKTALRKVAVDLLSLYLGANAFIAVQVIFVKTDGGHQLGECWVGISSVPLK